MMASTSQKTFNLRSYYANSFEKFCTDVLGLSIAEHHRQIITDLQSKRFCCFESFRGSGKTELCSVAYPLWLAFRSIKPFEILIISGTDKQAKNIIRRMQFYCETAPILQETLAPENFHDTTWSATQLKTKNNVFIQALPATSKAVLGNHVSFLICDDLYGDEDGDLEAVNHAFDYNIRPTINTKKGQLILIGCVNENTMILSDQGFSSIKNLKQNSEKLEDFNKPIYGFNGFHIAEHIFENGIKDTIKLKTKKGFELESTPNHPILILGENGFEWKKTDLIKVNDIVPIQNNQMVFGDLNYFPIPTLQKNHNENSFSSLCPEFTYLLGLYLADGCVEKTGRFTFSKTALIEKLSNYGFNLKFIQRDKIHIRISSKYLMEQFKSLGIKFVKAHKKEFPSIYGWNKDNVAAMIRGYADGDGCITGGHIKFTSTSKKLLMQLQIMLLNFGIVSSLTEFNSINKYKTFKIQAKHIRYDLSILAGYENIFIEQIGFSNPEKSRRLIRKTDRQLIGIHKFLYKAIKSLPRGKRKIKNIHYIYGAKSKKFKSFSLQQIQNYIIQIEKLHPTNQFLPILKELSSGNYFFDVIQKKSYGNSRTLDFIIPETHSFFSNGFISHNTPKSEKDLFARIREKHHEMGFCYKKYPAINLNQYGEWAESLWPDKFTLAELKQIKASMTAISWDREYMLESVSSGSRLFPEALIQKAIEPGLEASAIRKDSYYYLGCDIALSEKERADFSVFITLERRDKEPLRQVGLLRLKGVPTDEQLKELKRLNSIYKYSRILIEDNGLSMGLVDLAIKDAELGTITEGFVTSHASKEEILGKLEISMRNDQLKISDNELLVDELRKFGIKDRKGKQVFESLGKRDDCVLALCFALEAANRGIAFGYAFV
jgi:intein/homing endonuclease